MIYLSGKVVDGLPAMLTPRMGQRPPAGQDWAADTGRYASPEEYDDDRYLSWLAKLDDVRDRCLFATAPDVWGDWRATLELSLPMMPRIRALGFPVALVAQDGLETSGELNADLWDEFDALFIGGSDAWRATESMFALVRQANDYGKWTHLGRVNSQKRFDTARAAGFDSADGTVLRFDQSRPVRRWVERAGAQSGLGL